MITTQISKHPVYSEILKKLLSDRGVETEAEIEKFLNPDYDRDLYDPYLLIDMEKAVRRIVTAIEKNQKIMIFGDYDADGVPASALLAEFFIEIGFKNFDVYIPHRHNEQYGLSILAVEKFATEGVNLIITVDCGITAVAEVEKANKLGLDVIITDHHIAHGVLPQAEAVIDPKRSDCSYPDKMLSGTGVAFKLVQALIKSGKFNFTEGQEKWLLDLVAIATVSDMVPLLDENRALAFYGLKVLKKTRRPGLLYLFEYARLKSGHITEDDIGFTIGPRLNSAGRMSHASEAYYLLTTKEEKEAGAIAKHLETHNRNRRKLVGKILEEVEEKINQKSFPSVAVFGQDDWSIGVLGLAASRLSELYERPFFIWGKNNNGEIKGSCRGDGLVNMVELMQEVNKENIFIDFGGHAEAGGFSILEDNFSKLDDLINKAYKKLKVEKKDKPNINFDAIILPDQISWEFYNEIAKLAPFGVGNPKPVFLIENVELNSLKQFGKAGEHLEIKINSNGGETKAIAFFVCDDRVGDKIICRKFNKGELKIGDKVNFLVNIEKSTFGYRPELRLRIIDIFPA